MRTETVLSSRTTGQRKFQKSRSRARHTYTMLGIWKISTMLVLFFVGKKRFNQKFDSNNAIKLSREDQYM